MGFYPNTANQNVGGNLAVTGSVTAASANVTGAQTVGGILTENGGTKTSGSAPLLTPANSNGTAAQLTDTTRDYMIYVTVGTAGTAFTISIGPTAGVADNIVTAASVSTGELFSFRLPAGWFWEWAATTATLAQQSAIGC